MQDAIQENRPDDVKFSRIYDLDLFKSIARDCGSPALAKETGYLDRARFFAKDKFIAEAISDFAFYAGTIGKKHFRLIEIVVRKDQQHKGYGTLMMKRIIRLCRKRKLEKITLRTSRNETAVDFYRRFGGEITGINGDDYEMEIRVCFTS